VIAILGWMALGVVAWFAVGLASFAICCRATGHEALDDDTECHFFTLLCVAYWPVAVATMLLVVFQRRLSDGDDHV
jgi:hypothetical protein